MGFLLTRHHGNAVDHFTSLRSRVNWPGFGLRNYFTCTLQATRTIDFLYQEPTGTSRSNKSGFCADQVPSHDLRPHFPLICLYIALVMGPINSPSRIDFLYCGCGCFSDHSRVHVRFKFQPSGVTDRIFKVNIPFLADQSQRHA